MLLFEQPHGIYGQFHKQQYSQRVKNTDICSLVFVLDSVFVLIKQTPDFDYLAATPYTFNRALWKDPAWWATEQFSDTKTSLYLIVYDIDRNRLELQCSATISKSDCDGLMRAACIKDDNLQQTDERIDWCFIAQLINQLNLLDVFNFIGIKTVPDGSTKTCISTSIDCCDQLKVVDYKLHKDTALSFNIPLHIGPTSWKLSNYQLSYT